MKLRRATAGVPHVTVVGYAGGLAINKCTSASAGIGCIGVYRRDSLDTLMQEERAHFRVDAILAEKAGPLFVFLNLHRCGE